jgi:Putative Ig domain
MSCFNIAAAVRLRYGTFCALASLSVLSSPLAQANTAPKISGTPVTSVTAAHYYSWQPTASDTDGDKLTFSILNKPSWASFNSSTGRLYGTPIPPGNVGTFRNIVIKVSDGTYTASLPAFAVTVKALPDIPPSISGTPTQSVTAGQAYSFQPAATDANGLRVTFGILDKPSWLTFDTATGRLYGTPTASNVGTYSNIVITAYDGYYKASLPTFGISVQAAPVTVSSTTATVSWTPPTLNTDGTTLTDLAGYHLYYGTSESNLDQVVDITNPGLATYVLSSLSPATWYFAITAFNSEGAESDRSPVASIVTQ